MFRSIEYINHPYARMIAKIHGFPRVYIRSCLASSEQLGLTMQMSTRRAAKSRRFSIFLGVLLAVGYPAMGAMADAAGSATFYSIPKGEIAGPPGTLLRMQAVTAPLGRRRLTASSIAHEIPPAKASPCPALSQYQALGMMLPCGRSLLGGMAPPASRRTARHLSVRRKASQT